MGGLLTKVVKNEAMKNDPPEIYNWRVYVLSCSVSILSVFLGDVWLKLSFLQACFAGGLFGMDTGIIGGVLKMDTFRKCASHPSPSPRPAWP
jgi:hypothetical protein